MIYQELLDRIPHLSTDNLEFFFFLSTQSSPARCKECRHIEKWQCEGSFFFYCGITKSLRTQNGLKKVLCKTPACGLFEKEELAK
jgi:hypothetical protein